MRAGNVSFYALGGGYLQTDCVQTQGLMSVNVRAIMPGGKFRALVVSFVCGKFQALYRRNHSTLKKGNTWESSIKFAQLLAILSWI